LAAFCFASAAALAFSSLALASASFALANAFAVSFVAFSSLAGVGGVLARFSLFKNCLSEVSVKIGSSFFGASGSLISGGFGTSTFGISNFGSFGAITLGGAFGG